MATCPLPEHSRWAADVTLVSRARWAAWNEHDWFLGWPTLAIDVLSPSNTKAEIADKRQTCFSGGCQEFCLVDAITTTVQTWASTGVIKKSSESGSVFSAVMDAHVLRDSRIIDED